MTEYVVGFDLSLTAPAAVALPVSWHPGKWQVVRASHINPPSPKNDDLAGQIRRYITIALWAANFVGALRSRKASVSAAFVEQYGYHQNTAAGSRVMESGGVVRRALFERYGLVLHPVVASQARKLLLGKNPKSDPKVVVQDALFNCAGAPRHWTEDEVDAFVVANWGLSELEGTCLTLVE